MDTVAVILADTDSELMIWLIGSGMPEGRSMMSYKVVLLFA
ncbi:hypothetical protein [Chryseobacterium shigense]|nr:hypothetical protein [Chryseobacterium shigense]